MRSRTARATSARLSKGSPIPMKTRLVTARRPALASRLPRQTARARRTWSTISPASSCRSSPWRPVSQNEQARAQPTWLDTQTVVRPGARDDHRLDERPVARAEGEAKARRRPRAPPPRSRGKGRGRARAAQGAPRRRRRSRRARLRPTSRAPPRDRGTRGAPPSPPWRARLTGAPPARSSSAASEPASCEASSSRSRARAGARGSETRGAAGGITGSLVAQSSGKEGARRARSPGVARAGGPRRRARGHVKNLLPRGKTGDKRWASRRPSRAEPVESHVDKNRPAGFDFSIAKECRKRDFAAWKFCGTSNRGSS